jgi:hypothetical protein
MKSLCCLVMGLVALGFLAADVSDVAGQIFKKKTTTPTTPATDDAGGVFNLTLVAQDVLTKLKLTSDQKSEYTKLQKEFADKMKDIISQAKKDAADQTNTPAGKGKGKGKGTGGKTAEAPGASDAISLRNDYEDKCYDLLDEKQQQVWLDIKTKKGESLLTGGNNSTTTKPKK